MSSMVLNNAIGWAQFRLRRGVVNVVSTTIAYALLIIALIIVSLKIDPDARSADVFAFWSMALLGLQLATLVLFGTMSVNGSIRKDLNSGIIESHRLMDVSPVNAILGYLFGSTCQVLPIAAVNLLIGAVTTRFSPLSPQAWLVANGVLMAFALCAWTLGGVMAFFLRGSVWPLVVFIVISIIGHEVIPAMLPGLTVIVGPVIDETVFGILATGTWTPAHLASSAVDLALAMLFFAGMVRRYRRDDTTSFSPLFGLLLVAVWMGASALGIGAWDYFEPELLDVDHMSDETSLIASMLVGLILAILPMSGAAWHHAERRRRMAFEDPNPPRRGWPTPPVALLAATTITGVLCGVFGAWWFIWGAEWFSWHVHPDFVRIHLLPRSWRTELSLCGFLLATSYLIRLLHDHQIRLRLILSLWFFLIMLGPMLADFVRAGVVGARREEDMFSMIASLSPIGTLMFIWDDWEISPTPGIVFHVLLAILMGIGCHALRRRWKVQPPQAQPVAQPAESA